MPTRRAAVRLSLLACFLAVPIAGRAQTPCPASLPTSARIAATADGTSPPILALGRPTTLQLLPLGSVRFPAKPGRHATAGGFGGVAAIEIAEAHTYRVSLGSRAWVDVAANGIAITSVAHAHGARCSGIAKSVDFPLNPGRQLVEISFAPASEIAVLVAPTK